MSEHTAGPWKIENDEQMRIHTKNGGTVARLGCLRGRHSGPRKSSKELAANARLIAASPELLVACKAALAEFEMFVELTEPKEEDDPVDDYRWASKLAMKLRKAIAKAGG